VLKRIEEDQVQAIQAINRDGTFGPQVDELTEQLKDAK